MAVKLQCDAMIMFSLASVALNNGDAAECARLMELAVDSLRALTHSARQSVDAAPVGSVARLTIGPA